MFLCTVHPQSDESTRGPAKFSTFVYSRSSHRHKSAAPPKFEMVWLYRWPIPVGKRGIISSFKWFLPAFPNCRKGGRVGTLCVLYTPARKNRETLKQRIWVCVLNVLFHPSMQRIEEVEEESQSSSSANLSSIPKTEVSSVSLIYTLHFKQKSFYRDCVMRWIIFLNAYNNK